MFNKKQESSKFSQLDLRQTWNLEPGTWNFPRYAIISIRFFSGSKAALS